MSTPKRRFYSCEICGERFDRSHRPDNTLLARFPLDEKRCREWVRATGKEDLVYVPIERLHVNKCICGAHFEKQYFNEKGNRLTKFAVPTLNLYAEPLPDSVLEEFPCHLFSYKPKEDKLDKYLDLDTSSENLKLSDQGFNNTVPTATNQVMIVRSYGSGNKLSSQIEKLSKPKIGKQVNHKISHGGTYPCENCSKPDEQTDKTATLPQTDDIVEPNALNLEYITFDDFDLYETAIEEVYDETVKQVPTIPPPPPPPLRRLRKGPIKRKISPSSSDVKKKRLPKGGGKKKMTAKKEPSAEKKKRVRVNHNAEKKKTVKKNTVRQPREKKVVPELVTDQSTSGQDLVEHDFSTDMEEVVPLVASDKETPIRKVRVPKKLSTQQRKTIYLQQRNLKTFALKTLFKAYQINHGRKVLRKQLNSSAEAVASAINKKSPETFSLFKSLQIDPGINLTVMDYLEKRCATMSKKDKLCALLFHDVGLAKRLIYNPTTDEVEGFADLGEELYRTADIANRALVFMLQGLHQKIELPVAHYFVKGTISVQTLALLILKVIKAIHSIGFTIVTTVCDQRIKHSTSLNLLKEWSSVPREANFFNVDEVKIFIVFDVPHLFNSLRNNFYNGSGIILEGKTGKWSHLIEVVEKNNSMLHFHKLTTRHLTPRLTVKFSAQLLSNTVAAILKLMAEGSKEESTSQEYLETAHVVESFDRLFDCMNGPASRKDIVKHRREIVSKKTNHLELWKHYAKVLSTMHSLNTDSSMRAKNKRCMKGFLTTLSSLENIWNYVESKGFLYFNLRHLNLDCWENQFEIIRKLCSTITHPTYYHFKVALKSHIVTKLTAINQKPNCEVDSETIINFEDLKNQDGDKNTPDNLFEVTSAVQEILKGNSDVLSIAENEENLPDHFYSLFCDTDTEYLEIENSLLESETPPSIYIAGYLASVVLRKLPWQCDVCNCSLTIEDSEICGPIIYEYKEFWQWWPDKESITYPTLNLSELVDTLMSCFEGPIKSILHEKHLSMQAITMMLAKCDNLFWMCEEHRCNLLHILLVKLSHYMIRKECHRINVSSAAAEEINSSNVILEYSTIE